jgi:hypothetical protein
MSTTTATPTHDSPLRRYLREQCREALRVELSAERALRGRGAIDAATLDALAYDDFVEENGYGDYPDVMAWREAV